MYIFPMKDLANFCRLLKDHHWHSKGVQNPREVPGRSEAFHCLWSWRRGGPSNPALGSSHVAQILGFTVVLRDQRFHAMKKCESWDAHQKQRILFIRPQQNTQNRHEHLDIKRFMNHPTNLLDKSFMKFQQCFQLALETYRNHTEWSFLN